MGSGGSGGAVRTLLGLGPTDPSFSAMIMELETSWKILRLAKTKTREKV